MSDQWQINRAGLVNFWYYDEETFTFKDGKLLLRGANGSGKSVTMQSFLPVLLDGRKSPDRLDPFGSKARRMEDYLLGEKEIVNRDERTGYLFMEYVKKETGQYVTTGIGMQAKRNKQMKSWYFVITDNRRIGWDLHLTQNHSGEKIPLSEKELSNRLGAGGEVVSSQREYMELVNRHLFKFQSVDAYEDLIKLLIQLRSPKLSKDFKPTVIYEILESALPPLTDDEIRYLSDSIDHMDQAQQELERLSDQKVSVEKVRKAYDLYNRYILAEKAEKWKAAADRLRKKEGQVASFIESEKELIETLDRLSIREKELTMEEEVLEEKRDQLGRHEIWNLEKRKQELSRQSVDKKAVRERLEKTLDRKEGDYLKKRTERGSLEYEESNRQRRVDELLGDLQNLALEADFAAHAVNEADFHRLKNGGYDFAVWKRELREHQKTLADGLKMLEERERLRESYRELERESSSKKLNLDGILQQIEHADQWFTEEQQKLESAVFTWMKEHVSLSFSDQQRQRVARSIQGLYEENEYGRVKDVLQESLDAYKESVRSRLAEKKNERERTSVKMDEVKVAIDHLKQQKMIEPDRHEGTTRHRESLKEAGVRAVPFFEAVEFLDHVSEEEQARIESVLRKTGVLDSLITSEVITPEQDGILVPEPLFMAQTLADYLKPDVDPAMGISMENVDDVLRTIPLEETDGAFVIDPDGTYTMGLIKGHAPDEGPARFIGRTSRKRYMREKLATLEEEMAQWTSVLAEVEQAIAILQGNLDESMEWQRTIPSDGTLRQVQKEWLSLDRDRRVEQALLEETDRKWKQVQSQLSVLKQKLYEFSRPFSFDVNVESVTRAQEDMKDYEEDLNALGQAMVELAATRRRLADLLVYMEEVEEELDHLKGDIDQERDGLERLSREMRSIDEQLALQGAEEIRREIHSVQKRLAEAKSGLKQINQDLPQTASDLKRIQEKLSDARAEATFWGNMRDEWDRQVADEVAHGFAEVEEREPEAILDVFGNVLASYEKAKVQEQLTKAFFEEQSMLSEYRMSEGGERKEIPEWMNRVGDERFEAFLGEYHGLKDRRLIRFSYNGSQVSPYFLAAALGKMHEERKRNLDDQDRKLYEDIMLNHIGTILRSRIKRAAKWVRQMDRIMSARDNSSGLIFSIAWKAQTAETEEEMDTAELVKLLERDSKHLHEDDLDKITRHFQSRIARAKELISLRNEGSTLHQVLKEVLDYRKWFSFVLSYKRENEGVKRELTNNHFFRFSGGEKAMAMYIPLFTAAYSRYQDAAPDAPNIISLDEAFAGVDEQNIRDMFEVIEQLGFNYIMNSQALWGDYDTVPSLSIADLLRPKNADFVTVMRYEWDGVERKPMKDEEEEHERFELT